MLGQESERLTLNSASVSHTEPVSATPNTARTTPTSTSSSSAGVRTLRADGCP